MNSNSLVSYCFSFKGRINRAPYFFVPLLAGILLGTIFLVLTLCLTELALIIVSALMVPIFIVSGVSFQVRRLHDLNFSGWWTPLVGILGWVPILGWIPYLLLVFVRGTKGPNRFGEDPLEKIKEQEKQFIEQRNKEAV